MHQSDPRFRTLHALRIKGFAPAEAVAEIAGLDPGDLGQHLERLQAEELAIFRAARALWQLSPAGREVHAVALADDVGRPGIQEGLAVAYGVFLDHNGAFKSLCTEWQVRGGEPNDHTDAAYDARLVAQLVALDGRARHVVTMMSEVLVRITPYGRRLERACRAVQAGDTAKFTGVLCHSYHDVWMELHEDLLLTLGIDRAAEGST